MCPLHVHYMSITCVHCTPIPVTLPLTVLGAIWGRRNANRLLEQKNPFPCKVNKSHLSRRPTPQSSTLFDCLIQQTNRLAREIPMVHWRQSPWLHAILSGFLSFSAIYIELHYVFLSVWGSKIYTLYSVLLTAFLMLLLVAGIKSV